MITSTRDALLSFKIVKPFPVHEKYRLMIQAGLLTFGSTYRQRLPGRMSASDWLLLSSPITAAGPSPIFTGFPIMLLRAPELIPISMASSDLQDVILNNRKKVALSVNIEALRYFTET